MGTLESVLYALLEQLELSGMPGLQNNSFVLYRFCEIAPEVTNSYTISQGILTL
jgi:hypothetical protein